MAVYERTYRPYSGPRTAPAQRWLVVARYGLADVFASRLLTAFFVLCFLWPLVCLILVYLRHNAEALAILGLAVVDLLAIDAGFFEAFVLTPQSWLAFVLAVAVAPALVSPDLRNNGLALYLSRPVTRSEYVAGKLAVLAILMSAVTWVPALLLVAFQAYLEGVGWLAENAWVGGAVLVASWVWIAVLALAALAISAWVKWRPLARLLMIGVYFVAEAMGTVFNEVYHTAWGDLLRLRELRNQVWAGLFRLPPATDLPPLVAWLVLAVIAALSLLALKRKVRAYEVER